MLTSTKVPVNEATIGLHVHVLCNDIFCHMFKLQVLLQTLFFFKYSHIYHTYSRVTAKMLFDVPFSEIITHTHTHSLSLSLSHFT
jgi:hypothetical protein